ncbi:META domain-containing protein [Lacinutrix salivirga]
MKSFILKIFIVAILFTSCNENKKETIVKQDNKTEVKTTKTETTLEDTRWKLVTFMGKDVSNKGAFITFSSKNNTVYGNASCNTFNGTYELKEGLRLSLSKMAATLKACPDMSIETPFLEILENVDNYSLSENTMTLNKAKMAPYAIFEAVR